MYVGSILFYTLCFHQNEWGFVVLVCKGKFVPLAKHYALKVFEGHWGKALCILNLMCSRWRWVVQVLYPPRKGLWFHWIGGWVGIRASLDMMANRKILLLSRIEPE